LSRLSCILSAIFIAGAGAVMPGCSTTLATRAPRGLDLGGEWQIDLALSDFPQEAVAAQSPIIGGPTDSGSGQPGGRGHGGRRGSGGAGGMPMAGGTGRASLEHHFAMPPHLSISQSGGVFMVDITMPDGKHVSNAYTAGEKSVVNTTRGAANRTLGWDGDGFLIRTQVGDKGPQSDVRYALEHDGTLSVTSTITHSGIYDFQYTLEYDRAVP
jgi:hypothetical protein